MSLRNKKKLLIEQLDKKLKPFKTIENVQIPTDGWISHIRRSLNMTLEQLGNKLNITKQGAKNIQKSEVSGSISLRSLRDAGEALGMRFVYGFVPLHGSAEKFVEMKANELARRIVLRTNQSMLLEKQGNSSERIDKAIEELAGEIKLEMRKSLWN